MSSLWTNKTRKNVDSMKQEMANNVAHLGKTAEIVVLSGIRAQIDKYQEQKVDLEMKMVLLCSDD